MFIAVVTAFPVVDEDDPADYVRQWENRVQAFDTEQDALERLGAWKQNYGPKHYEQAKFSLVEVTQFYDIESTVKLIPIEPILPTGVTV